MVPIVIISLLIFVLPKKTEAASITFDATAVSANTTTSPITWSHTVTSSGTNTFLVVGVALKGNTGTPTPTAVSFNSVSMTKIREDINSDSSSNILDLSIWVLKSPTSGSHTVSVTYTLSGVQQVGYGFSLSYSGVIQANTVDAQAATSSTTGTIGAQSFPITTINDNDWISTFCIDYSLNAAATCNFSTNRSAGAYVGAAQALAQSGDSNAALTPPGAKNISFTTSASNQKAFVLNAVALAPAPIPINHALIYIQSSKDFINKGIMVIK